MSNDLKKVNQIIGIKMTADKNNDLKISFFGYNTFIIETGDKKIAIDLGALFF